MSSYCVVMLLTKYCHHMTSRALITRHHSQSQRKNRNIERGRTCLTHPLAVLLRAFTRITHSPLTLWNLGRTISALQPSISPAIQILFPFPQSHSLAGTKHYLVSINPRHHLSISVKDNSEARHSIMADSGSEEQEVSNQPPGNFADLLDHLESLDVVSVDNLVNTLRDRAFHISPVEFLRLHESHPDAAALQAYGF